MRKTFRLPGDGFKFDLAMEALAARHKDKSTEPKTKTKTEEKPAESPAKLEKKED